MDPYCRSLHPAIANILSVYQSCTAGHPFPPTAGIHAVRYAAAVAAWSLPPAAAAADVGCGRATHSTWYTVAGGGPENHPAGGLYSSVRVTSPADLKGHDKICPYRISS